MAEFTIEATFGDATLAMAVQSQNVDFIVTTWTEKLQSLGIEDQRVESRQLVVKSLMEETHHEPGESENVAAALVWLAATGPYGERLLPLMRAGGIAVGFEITRLGPTTFNFRLNVDEGTVALLR